MILNVTYGFRTNKALSVRQLPSSMSLSPFRRLVGITGVSLALQELLYGLIMALIFITAARVGVLHYTDRENLVILIMGMNLTWGAIDAIVFYLLDIFSHGYLSALLMFHPAAILHGEVWRLVTFAFLLDKNPDISNLF